MTKEVEIQVISSSVAPTAPRMWVSATLTIEASIAPIRVPKETDTVTSHLLVGARAGAASDRGMGSEIDSLIKRPPRAGRRGPGPVRGWRAERHSEREALATASP